MLKVQLILMAACLLFAGQPGGYQPGDRVADFSLKNFDGKMVSLADYHDQKGIILIFDCNTCPYSKAYNQRIIALNAKFAPKGYPVLTINANDGPGDAFQDNVARATSKGYTFAYLQDDTQAVARAFGATNTPHVFVLERKDKDFFVRYIGAIDNHSRNAAQADKKYVEDAVNALLQGKPVTVDKTRAIGCGIKWQEA